MPIISVIVPVYNVERYLAACLDSIRSQTFSDLEVLCINDGSPDRSGEILDLYSRLDERFHVITIENQGVSHARNLGIEIARGTYLCFVDSDDLLAPQACETVVRTFEASNADIIKFSAEPFPAALSDYWTNVTLALQDETFVGYSSELVFDRHARPFPWNGAYRTAFLRDNSLSFPEDLSLGEDQVFSFATLCRSHVTRLLSQRLYRYRLARADSLTARAASDQVGRLVTHQQVIRAVLKDWRNEGHMQGKDAAKMLDFVCSFLLFDIFELDNLAGRDGLLRSLRDLLRSQFSPSEIESEASGPEVRLWLKRVLDYDGHPERFGRSAVYGLTRALYGRKALLRRFVRDAKSSILPARLPEDIEDIDEGEDVDAVLARLTRELEMQSAGK